jgi:hypothetical protein
METLETLVYVKDRSTVIDIAPPVKQHQAWGLKRAAQVGDQQEQQQHTPVTGHLRPVQLTGEASCRLYITPQALGTAGTPHLMAHHNAEE